MKVIRNIYRKGLVKRNPPCNIQKDDEHLFGGPAYEHRFDEANLVEIKNVWVTSNGIILKNLVPVKRFIVYYRLDFRLYWKRYVLHVLRKFKKQKVVQGDYLLIFDNYTSRNGLAHWISDGLTRLIEIKDELKDHKILVPEFFLSDPIFEMTVRIFELRNLQVIKDGHYIKLPKLKVCDHLAESGNYRPENLLKLREFIFSKLNLKSNTPGTRLYISRKKAKRRFVLNEEEVEKLMGEYGFRTVCMEDYEFSEQMKLAHNAEIIVTIHGAALSHILFMNTGTTVLEFRKDGDNDNGMFYALADAIGINYYYLSCKSVFNNNIANNFDLQVDIPKLENTLKLIQSHEKDRY